MRKTRLLRMPWRMGEAVADVVAVVPRELQEPRGDKLGPKQETAAES